MYSIIGNDTDEHIYANAVGYILIDVEDTNGVSHIIMDTTNKIITIGYWINSISEPNITTMV